MACSYSKVTTPTSDNTKQACGTINRRNETRWTVLCSFNRMRLWRYFSTKTQPVWEPSIAIRCTHTSHLRLHNDSAARFQMHTCTRWHAFRPAPASGNHTCWPAKKGATGLSPAHTRMNRISSGSLQRQGREAAAGKRSDAQHVSEHVRRITASKGSIPSTLNASWTLLEQMFAAVACRLVWHVAAQAAAGQLPHTA